MLAAIAATMLMAAVPGATMRAATATDSVATQTKAHDKGVTVAIHGVTVNGRPATKQQRDVVKAMVKQGGRMAGKGMQMATSALTAPSRAEQIGDELEAMGDELERMGDSLEALADDTTFLYDGVDADSIVLAEDDIDDFISDVTKSFHFDFGDTWWGRLLGGGLGIMAGLLAIVVALMVVALIIGIVTAPLWIAALIIYLIVRNDRGVRQRRPGDLGATTPHAATATDGNATDGAADAAASGAAAAATMTVDGVAAENRETWMSGVRQCCLGVGLIVFFCAIGWDGFWGIGALVACLGVAKLVIAYSSKPKDNYYRQPRDVAADGDSPATSAEDGNYAK
ncbi:MAG: hypothetical protein IJS59_06680 [Bacteroidaceae bacterium]|nr:hypothetical protein [Bacteroidaceae bacterium]